jgi:hypothetical protein
MKQSAIKHHDETISHQTMSHQLQGVESNSHADKSFTQPAGQTYTLGKEIPLG